MLSETHILRISHERPQGDIRYPKRGVILLEGLKTALNQKCHLNLFKRRLSVA